MVDRRLELLDYIRTLYDRQNSRASKAGMTFWTILAGMIYVVWQLLQTLSDLEVKTSSLSDFYRSFSQIHLVIISISFLIVLGRKSNVKRDLDYRVFREEGGVIAVVVLMFIFLGSPLFAINYIIKFEVVASYFSWQVMINYYALVFVVVTLIAGFFYEIFKRKEEQFPPVSTLISDSSALTRAFKTVISLVLIEISIGNSLNTITDVYGSDNIAKTQMAAFDISLLIFGCFFLFRNGKTDERLDRLASFERDILVHNLSEKEIIERLQDDFLGKYLGDWISQKLSDIKEKAQVLINHSQGSSEILREVESIDLAYERERTGRVGEYLADLEEKNESYLKSLTPLVNWLEKLSNQAALHKDDIMLVLVKESISDINKSSKDVREEVNCAISNLKGWLEKYSNRAE
ncbi:hypothetical protein [Amphritea pacifica]|uniref:hypothetical protein n=1 Tax=Amphritea pacifica TaxID=2811233 RepID=UPI0019663287|nr:hypothetical protein [Amphritea pacifica]MBN1005075.1 hypothetical protein [Amphritea pacifica]